MSALDRRLVDATGMALYQAYYEGKHRETYKIRRVIEAFGLRMPIYVNYAGVVVDSISERLGVDGFTFGGDDRASAAAWEIWQDNNLDAGFKRGMRSGLIKGEFSLVLWPDEDWSPRIWVEDGAEVITSRPPRDRRAPGRAQALDRRRRAGRDVRQPVPARRRLQVPDAASRRTRPAPSSRRSAARPGSGGSSRASRGRCPTRSAKCRSSRSPTSPTCTSSASPSSARSCRSRTRSTPTSRTSCWPASTGPSARRSCSTSRSRSTRPPAPRSSRSTSRSTRSSRCRRTQPGEPEPRLAEFSQTDLAGYIKVHETLVQAIATASRFPPHYLLGTQGTFPSGESLTAVERGISAVAGERGDDWKDPLEDAMRLAFRIKARAPGNSAAAAARFEKWAAMTGAEAAFRNPETKSESQHVDAVTKKKDLDVPRRQLWTELGYSQQQILDWEAELAAAPPEPALPVVPTPTPAPYIPGPIDSTGGTQPPS